MSTKASRRMSNSPETPLRNGRNRSSSSSSSSTSKANSNCRKRVTSIFAVGSNNFPSSKIKPSALTPAASFVKRLRAQVAKGFSFMSFRRRKHKVSSSAMLPRSRSLAESVESHRAEAVEDCIEFLNSSSFSRSNSVSKASC